MHVTAKAHVEHRNRFDNGPSHMRIISKCICVVFSNEVLERAERNNEI